jgi:hypothetical protein
MDEPISNPHALNYKIDNLFFELTTLKPEDLVKAKLDEIFSHLKNNKHFINPYTLAMLFKHLGELENYKQALAKDLMVFGIHYAQPLLSKKQLFGRNELVHIFNATPKLPISWEIHREFIHVLREQLKQELKKEADAFTDSQVISILGALAKLGLLPDKGSKPVTKKNDRSLTLKK